MKILVVDDEQDMQVLFQQSFRKEIRQGTYEFVYAFSGEEALKVLTQMQHEAVLILSDVNMPGMSGLQLLAQIKKQYDNPPPKVMMITAYGTDEVHNEAKRLGADDFLTKPIDFKQLKQKLNPIK